MGTDVCVPRVYSACGGQKASGLVELQLQAVVTYVCVLGIVPRSYEKAAKGS